MSAAAPAAPREAYAQGRLALAQMLWKMRRDALTPFAAAVGEHDIAQARIPGLRIHSVHRPAHVERVLVTNHGNYAKGPDYDLFATALGRGLVTSRGELWRRQRRLVQPLFAKRHLAPFADAMTAGAQDLRAAWSALPDGSRVDVWRAMNGLTLAVAGRALFGADLTARAIDTISSAVTAIMSELSQAGRSPLFWGAQALPGMTVERALRLRPRRQPGFRAAIRALDAVVAETIERGRARVAADGPGDDLLSLLLAARDERTGAPMDARQLRDEVVTFLIAGHDTTAAGLTWTWWLLATHPEVRERLYAEVDAVLGGRAPAFADVDALPWTLATIKEAMRLYPPVWVLLRRAVEDDEIDGVRIPAGTTVVVFTYLTHRDPDVWPDPGIFDPSRFLPGEDRERVRHAYIPFSAGRRGCVGQSFALAEIVLVTAAIAQRHVLDVDPSHAVAPDALLTLRPRGGMPMRLAHR